MIFPLSLYIPLTGALKFSTENHHFSVSPSLHTPYWCIKICHRKPSLFSLPHYIPLTGALKIATENHHFSVFLTTYPLLVHSKVPQKTITFQFPYLMMISLCFGAGSYKWLWPFIYLLHSAINMQD